MKINILNALVLSTIFLTSCEKMFNTVVDIDIPTTEGMVLECLPPQTYEYGPWVSPFQTALSLTNKRKVTGSDKVQSIDNAQIHLFENDILVDSFSKQSGTPYLSNFYSFQEKGNYKIIASSPDYPTIEASDVMPSQAEIQTITHTAQSKKLIEYEQLEWFDKIEITIQDSPALNEQYKLVLKGPTILDSFLVQTTDTMYYEVYAYDLLSSMCKYVTDPMYERDTYEEVGSSTNCRYEPLYFNDNSFNGQSRTLEIYIPSYLTQQLQGTPLYIELQILSDHSYKYQKSKAYYFNNEGNPFAEPTQIYSNVQNGLGVFGLSSLAVDSVQL